MNKQSQRIFGSFIALAGLIALAAAAPGNQGLRF